MILTTDTDSQLEVAMLNVKVSRRRKKEECMQNILQSSKATLSGMSHSLATTTTPLKQVASFITNSTQGASVVWH